MTCICHTDIIPGVDVGVAVYYRYTAEVRENVTNKQNVLKTTLQFCKGSPKIFPPKPVNSPSLKNILFRFCQRWFPPFQYILLNISNFYLLYFENTSRILRMAQKYILSLNHIIWDPAYQLKSISMKSLRLWLLFQIRATIKLATQRT